MTHTTISEEVENRGSTTAVFHTIDITSLDAAGAETYDPEAETNISGADRYGISVRAQEDESLQFTWDHVAADLSVTNVADGTAVTGGTDVGEVILEVVGV